MPMRFKSSLSIDSAVGFRKHSFQCHPWSSSLQSTPPLLLKAMTSTCGAQFRRFRVSIEKSSGSILDGNNVRHSTLNNNELR
eukprot:UN12240